MLYKKTCANCGAEFETERLSRIYCSNECSKVKNNKRRLKLYCKVLEAAIKHEEKVYRIKAGEGNAV